LRELIDHVSGIAAITQQEYASSPEWAFNRMADPTAAEVARYLRGDMPAEIKSSTVAILRRHGIVPERLG
jgi:hypothetical protein